MKKFSEMFDRSTTLNPKQQKVAKAESGKARLGLDRAKGDINEGNPNQSKQAIKQLSAEAKGYRAMFAKKSDSVSLGKKLKDAVTAKLMDEDKRALQLGQGGAIYAKSDLPPKPTTPNRSLKKS